MRKGVNKAKSMFSHHNFRVNELKTIISLLLKYYDARKNRGKHLSKEESEEYDILKGLADTLGLSISTRKGIDRWSQ